jgi:hypothetical protein
MYPDQEQLRSIIVTVLEGSDIVWPKYGYDTRGMVADRILREFRKSEFHILDDGDYHELAGTYE